MTVRAFLGVVVRASKCATCHRNGTATYFDPLKGQWIEGARTVPIHALAVLPRDEEERVRRHLGRNFVFPAESRQAPANGQRGQVGGNAVLPRQAIT